jgi:hypothetical protein
MLSILDAAGSIFFISDFRVVVWWMFCWFLFYFPDHILFTLLLLQLKVTLYLLKIYLLTQRLNSLKMHLNILGQSSVVAFKSGVVRSGLHDIFAFHPNQTIISVMLMVIPDDLQQGFCFGFVEFETMSSMQGALEVMYNTFLFNFFISFLLY